MKRRIFYIKTVSVMLVLMMLFSLAGCGGGKSSVSPGETKTITDCIGRTVEIPKDPQRVACLYATTAHIMAMLEQGDKMVGCPNGIKMDVLMTMKYPDVGEMAVPYQEGSINVEELLRIDADLVLVRYSTAANEGEIEKLEDLGIPYVVVDFMTTDELKTAISVMGEVFDQEEKAQKYIEFSNETIAMVQERLGDIPREQWPEAYHSVNEAIRTDGQGNICEVIMNMACVKNVSAENGMKEGGEKTYTTLEEIYKWDPDAFIANEYSVTEYILEDSKWAGLTAVKNKAVYTLPVGATRWCHPNSMEAHMAVLAIAIQFWPEKFTDFDMAEYTQKYYKEYFGLDLDDQIVNNILEGKGMRKSNSPM